jgi:hypothetical protein
VVLRCEECASQLKCFERGWRCVHAGDPDRGEVVPAYYCPVCAERELDGRRADELGAPIRGGVQVARSARMSFVIEFDRQEADVVITTAGAADPDGFFRCNRALVADSRFHAGASILVDHTALDPRPLTESDVRELGASIAAIRERLGTSRIACVVPGSVARRLAFAALARATPGHIHSHVFHSRSRAAAWLRRNVTSNP